MQEDMYYFEKGDFIVNENIKQTFLKNPFTRLLFYSLQTLLFKSFLLITRLSKRRKRKFKYSVSICAIFKNEAKFLDEWIKFHLVIGVDHFYLYNNNSNDHYFEILKPYIDKGVVDLFDWPQSHAQMRVYEDCYNKFKNETNWLTFIDIDEFICPISNNNIKSSLSSFNGYPSIAVYWKQFGSNGKLTHDYSIPVIEQYTQCWPKYSSFTKMFCNMNFSFKLFKNPHKINSYIYGLEFPPTDQFKNLISFGINRSISNKKPLLQINHYWGKAFDSFVESKINRSDVFHEDDVKMSNLRKNILKHYENMCTDREFLIHRFLLDTKLYNI